jgi:AAA family ATP:ADP antiporter
MIKDYKLLFKELKSLDAIERKNIYLIGLVSFLILFSYPFIRNVSEVLFIEYMGAQKSPYAWMLTVLGISFAVFLYDRLQKKFSIHWLFFGTCVFSFGFFALCTVMLQMGYKIWAYPLSIWRDAYIMLILHMAYGYLNAYLDVRKAKLFLGPLGAAGGLAGMIGSAVVEISSKHLTEPWLILYGGNFFILFTLIAFWQTSRNVEDYNTDKNLAQKRSSPLKSLGSAKGYVFLIIGITFLTQFCVNLAQYKFNIAIGDLVSDKMVKTQVVSRMYFYVNMGSFLIQILITPLALKHLSVYSIQRIIPVTVLLVVFFGFYLGTGLLAPVTIAFAIIKTIDYSIFQSSKELLYYPLNDEQKYGAKYLADMISYRFAKGLISVVLLFFSTSFATTTMLFGFLFIWIYCITPLKRLTPKGFL